MVSEKNDHGQGSSRQYFFSLIELPSQFSTLDFSFDDMDPQISGATARAKPVWSDLEPTTYVLGGI
jgi:hypothetical protein